MIHSLSCGRASGAAVPEIQAKLVKKRGAIREAHGYGSKYDA